MLILVIHATGPGSTSGLLRFLLCDWVESSALLVSGHVEQRVPRHRRNVNRPKGEGPHRTKRRANVL